MLHGVLDRLNNIALKTDDVEEEKRGYCSSVTNNDFKHEA
jgi:hypothetical protein